MSSQEIFRLMGTTAGLKPVSVATSAGDIRRPRYSVLDKRVLKDAGADVKGDWQDALAGYKKPTKLSRDQAG
jgi:dTDP-4-dehydrorhamnose reductase